ncbi:MAG TPA: ABC transporter permease [Thermoanaerobaculia bacterium]|jgi:putative ABC transport system permease protein
MRNYIKLALKVLTRRKFFTFISLFGITLTLVVLVVATAILDDLFAATGPESRFDRVLVIHRLSQYGPQATESTNPGYGFLAQYVLNLPGVERATAFTDPLPRTIYLRGGRIDTQLRRTDANYWKVLDFRFIEGRPFTEDEVARGSFVAVISDELRRKLFDGASAAGRTVVLDGQRFTVIGVVPAASTTRLTAYSDMWVPHTTAKSSEYTRQIMGGNFMAVLLLHDASDRKQLKNRFAEVLPRVPVTDPKVFKGYRAGLDTPFEAFARDMVNGPGLNKFRDRAGTFVRILLGVLAVLFMTLPALNLVTLNLSRILERAPEIGVRKAFGARRGALVSQFVLENVVLTVIGGVIAYVLASIVLFFFNRSGVVPHAEIALNLRVFGYGLLVAIFFGVFSGAYPAWRMSRLDPVSALRGGVA